MHPTTHFVKLNDGAGADIDVRVAPIVNYLTDLGAETISSCQGDPGVIGEGGSFGHVAFLFQPQDKYEKLAHFLFIELRPLVMLLDDDVKLEMTLSENLITPADEAHGEFNDELYREIFVHSSGKFESKSAFIGWLKFRTEAIDEITKRLGCYVEMLHK